MDRHGFRIIQRNEGLRADLARLTDAAERLYWRLMLACDQHGCHRAETNTILGSVLVGTSTTAKAVERAVGELVVERIVDVWDADDGARWLEIVGFDTTQTAGFIANRGRRLAPPNPNLDPREAVERIIPSKKAKATVDDKMDEPTRELVRAVFEHWKAGEARTGGATRAILTDDRKTLIKKRLDDGFTVGDLKAAVDGYHASPWHLGKNDRQRRYTDIELALRNASKVEAGIQRSKQAASDANRFSEYDQ